MEKYTSPQEFIGKFRSQTGSINHVYTSFGMSKRFGNILKGSQEATALQNYLKYISDPTSRQTKRLNGGTRDTQRERAEESGYILPFGESSNTAILLKFSKTSLNAFTGFQAALIETNRLTPVTGTAPAPAGAEQLSSSYKPARAHVFVPDGSANYVQSKITKEYYIKYGGKSHSLPFGRTGAAELVQVGEKAVKTALITAGAGAQYFRVSITPEKVYIPF